MCSVVPDYSPGFKKPPEILRLKRKRPRRSETVALSGESSSATTFKDSPVPPRLGPGSRRRNPFTNVGNTPCLLPEPSLVQSSTQRLAEVEWLVARNDVSSRSEKQVNWALPSLFATLRWALDRIAYQTCCCAHGVESNRTS